VTASIGALSATRLLVRLRVRRIWNQISGFYRYRMGSPDRKATSRTSPVMGLLTGFVALSMLAIATQYSYQGIANMEVALGSVAVQDTRERRDLRTPGRATERQQASPKLQRLPAAPGSVLSPGVFQGATFIVTLLLIVALLMTVGSRDIARPEWDLEWLITLPIPLSTLLVSRLLERVATGAAGVVTLAPFLSVLAWHCGYRWTAPVLGLALTVPFLFLLAIAQALIDTGLRLALPPYKLKNLHAVMTVVSVPLLFVVMSAGMPGISFIWGWAGILPEWAAWLPPGLAVHALASVGAGSAAVSAALMVAEILLLVAIGFALLQRQMRHGVVAAGVRDAVPRGPPRPRVAAPARLNAPVLLSAVQRRELRLLARDRTFMVQTLFFPALLIGTQVLINTGLGVPLTDLADTPHLAAMAFGLAAYSLTFSAFQVLNAEGPALWIMYCVPHSLESVLRQKATMWAALATLYPLVLFAVAATALPAISAEFLARAAVVLAGVPIAAIIATALGVFGCDPLEQDVQRRMRLTYVYLNMLLASLYIYAIYASSIWQRLALIVLTGLVAMALWQKARDQFDYLLDPSASPPSRVSLSDGLIAALLFFVLQGILVIILAAWNRSVTWNAIWLAFCIAGAVSYSAMRLVYWRARTEGVPRLLNDGVPRALLWGIGGGTAVALVGVAYLQTVTTMNLFPDARPAAGAIDSTAAIGLAILAIAAAPLCEEFIFRGLVFGGLRRSHGLMFSVAASAAIFAIVHPAVSALPVFVMGAVAAVVYDRTRMLAAPIAVHAIYNAAVIAFQWS
jgi:ABC-2 type transport system permease protein